MQKLTARVDILQAKMDQLIIQLDEEKTLRSNLQAMNKELSYECQKQAAKIDFFMGQTIIKQEEEVFLLKKKIINGSYNSHKQPTEKMSDDPSPQLLPPSSCRQLSTIGHYLDGIYLVANPDTNKIETVYCVFESSARKIIL